MPELFHLADLKLCVQQQPSLTPAPGRGFGHPGLCLRASSRVSFPDRVHRRKFGTGCGCARGLAVPRSLRPGCGPLRTRLAQLAVLHTERLDRRVQAPGSAVRRWEAVDAAEAASQGPRVAGCLEAAQCRSCRGSSDREPPRAAPAGCVAQQQHPCLWSLWGRCCPSPAWAGGWLQPDLMTSAICARLSPCCCF